MKKGQFSINQCPIEISLRYVELQIAIQSLICLRLHSLCLSDSNLVSLHFNFNLKNSHVSQIKGISNSISWKKLADIFPKFNFKFNFLWFKVELGSTSNCEATEETSVTDTSDLVFLVISNDSPSSSNYPIIFFIFILFQLSLSNSLVQSSAMIQHPNKNICIIFFNFIQLSLSNCN